VSKLVYWLKLLGQLVFLYILLTIQLGFPKVL